MADDDSTGFILINAAEVVDAMKKGLIMRASLLAKKPVISGFPVKRVASKGHHASGVPRCKRSLTID